MIRTYRQLAPPLPPHAVPRSRLTDAVLDTPERGVLAVSAPPGYGATTAVAQALTGIPEKVHWVTVDAGTPDGEARELLVTGVGSAPGTPVVDAVLAEAHPAWLVVDGLVPTVHRGLTADLVDLAQHQPDRLRLVIISRHRFLRIPRALHLGAGDLAFTTDEALALLQTLLPGVDIDDAQTVITAAEGWAAALVAGGSHLRAQDDATWLLKAGAVALLHDWFRALPVEQQRFLTITSVLEVLRPPVAAAVSQEPEAAAVLLELEAANAHVRELPDGPERSWRRHLLLTTFLEQLGGADRLAAHSRAADWFMAADDVPSAMRHLLAAGRHHDAAEFLRRHESRLLSERSDMHQVLSWVEQLGPAASDRMLHLLRIGWAQALSADVRAADATLGRLTAELGEQVDPGLPEAGVQPRSWTAEVALLRAYLATFHADPASVVANARRVILEPTGLGNGDSDQVAPLLLARGQLWAGRADAAALTLT